MELLRSNIVQYCAVELSEILDRRNNRRNGKLFFFITNTRLEEISMTRQTLFKSSRHSCQFLRDKTQGQRHWMDDRER